MANPGSRLLHVEPSDLAQLGDVELQERIDQLDREAESDMPLTSRPSGSR